MPALRADSAGETGSVVEFHVDGAHPRNGIRDLGFEAEMHAFIRLKIEHQHIGFHVIFCVGEGQVRRLFEFNHDLR